MVHPLMLYAILFNQSVQLYAHTVVYSVCGYSAFDVAYTALLLSAISHQIRLLELKKIRRIVAMVFVHFPGKFLQQLCLRPR